MISDRQTDIVNYRVALTRLKGVGVILSKNDWKLESLCIITVYCSILQYMLYIDKNGCIRVIFIIQRLFDITITRGLSYRKRLCDCMISYNHSILHANYSMLYIDKKYSLPFRLQKPPSLIPKTVTA